MVFYAISSLLKANAELVGFEAEHGLAREGWETSVTEDGPAWRAAALAKEGELRTEFFATFDATYRELMGKVRARQRWSASLRLNATANFPSRSLSALASRIRPPTTSRHSSSLCST